MKGISFLLLASLCSLGCFCQKYNLDSSLNSLKFKKDSTLHAMIYADSVKIGKEYMEKEKWEKLKAIAVYPVLYGGDNSGVLPVEDVSEVPDPNMEYRLLFEIISNNPDSAAKEINYGLAEAVRIINLHVASGIPLKKMRTVIVVHGPALNAITTDEYYKEHYKVSNPNLKLINDLKRIGTGFIACGQAMSFFDVKREALLPIVKVSLTAQTVLSSYQLKGYVKFMN